MAKFGNLAKSFDEGLTDKAKINSGNALKKSLSVIGAIEKLKNQGIAITKKAQMDYLLAMRHVERISQMEGTDLLREYRKMLGTPAPSAPVAPDEPDNQQPAETAAPPASAPAAQKAQPPNGGDVKRNPKDNPKEFQAALKYSLNMVREVEALKRENQPIPPEKINEYEMCKKFLAKYAG